MPVIVKLPSGNWRAQVRRKGKYISNTFRRRADADTWALETERTIDKGLNPKAINPRSVHTFGDTARKITSTWQGKGEYAGFNAHLRKVAQQFPHIEIHPEIWLKTRPPTSASAHLFLTAVQHWHLERGRQCQSESAISIYDEVMWVFRCGFFKDCRDIARWEVQCELAEALGVDINAIEKRIHDGTAFARLSADYQDAEKMRIEGSSSLVLNGGRQKLYGDVGFRIIEANIEELLWVPGGDQNAPEPPFIHAAKSPYLSDDEQSTWHFHRSGSPIYQRQNEADFSAPF
jgi:predicted DsbA family dithiol-disulfide isomerase